MQPKRLRRPRTIWGDLVRILWRAPAFSVPFGLFFGTLFGSHGTGYVDAFILSLFFSTTIMLFLWITEWLLIPRFISGASAITHGLVFGSMSLLGSFVAAILIHFTIEPGFLGDVRSIAVVGMFALLFVALFLGAAFSMHFYRDSIERAKTDQELDLARRIQRSFLLSQFPTLPRLEMHAVNVSSKQVSGDFYDVVSDGGTGFWIAVADVSGKGVPAALLSSMLQAALRTQAHSPGSVSDVMGNINRLAYDRSPSEQFATFVLARVDESAARLTYVNAGHNFPLHFRRGVPLTTLETGGVPVGFLPDAAYSEETLDLTPGDRLVFYTDGITEAMRHTGEMFGEARLVEAVAAIPLTVSAKEITDRVLTAVRVFLGDTEPGDDMTVLVLRVHDPA